MTYCVALTLDAGVVLLADSRTNAGVDDISTFGKLFTWQAAPGAPARAIGVTCSGNLSVTQEIVSLIDEEIQSNGPAQEAGRDTILTAPSLFRVAERFGNLMIDVQNRRGGALAAAGVSSAASLIVAGQISGEAPEAYLVYTAGNFIQATRDRPFIQIGEVKYGKPILDRVVGPETSIADGVKGALLSMDATMRSNLSVGMPLDLAVLATGSFQWRRRRIEPEDAVFQQISRGWGEHLRAGFAAIPEFPY